MISYHTCATHVKKFKWSWGTALVVLIVSIIIISRLSVAIGSIGYGLTPPSLPEYKSLEQHHVNPEGWEGDSQWFHHATQGTATLPIPYEWLLALEAPKSSPWWGIFSWTDAGPFMGEYILRLGFIESKASATNPDGLPIGIAKTDSIYFPGVDRKASAAGFTCAACHTGQMVLGNKRYIIDGGPAMTDLGLLTQSLGAALGQTALASNLVFFNGRFERFAQRVLGSNDNIVTRTALKKDLANTMSILITKTDTINVTEGFTRLDALNRIGNQVFSQDMGRNSNYSPINAPVNYPHLWTTSWFDWVQYDGSIMQPLIRNTGEALGVSAYVDVTAPDNQRFASSANIHNLVKIEEWLAGTDPFKNNKQFNGLLAPKWPSSFPDINKDLAREGEALYGELCAGCHLPPVGSDEFWSDKHWQPIAFKDSLKDAANNEIPGSEEIFKTDEKYLKLNIIPLEEIGTDPAQANVLVTRTVDATGLNLNTKVCTPVKDGSGNVLKYVNYQDSATANFGLALGAFVERTNNQWFNQNFIAQSDRPVLEGLRPNCLQVGAGYKARPLNGVWATAPFLHNGSVATLYDLLSPLESRPTFVELGNQSFDANHVGIEQGDKIKRFNKDKSHRSEAFTADYDNGRFILDTRELGNHNSGHLFTDDKAAVGKIGPKLTEDQKFALIEFLKTQ